MKTKGPKPLPPEEQFWKHVNKNGPYCERLKSYCWVWSGWSSGYGQIRIYGKLFVGNRIIMAHRFSWTLHNGDIPYGLLVCHQCDNPSCVRPDHLFVGTQKDNMRDCRDKGRLVTYGNSKRTCCKHGHEYTVESTRIDRLGHRHCRICTKHFNSLRDRANE